MCNDCYNRSHNAEKPIYVGQDISTKTKNTVGFSLEMWMIDCQMELSVVFINQIGILVDIVEASF